MGEKIINNNLQTNQKKKVDRRIIKTKRAICTALTEILGYKEINEISICEIAQKAQVNRKTIYNYYPGIHEIIDDIENSLVESYESVFEKIDFDTEAPHKFSYKIFDTISSIINDNIDFYSRLIKINGNLQFIQKIIGSIEDRLKESLNKKGYDTNKTGLMAHFIVNGMISAYDYWFSSGRVQPLDEFSKDVSKIVYNGINCFLD